MTALKVFKYTSYLQPGLHLIHFASIRKAKKVYIQSPIEASSVNCTTYNAPTFSLWERTRAILRAISTNNMEVTFLLVIEQ